MNQTDETFVVIALAGLGILLVAVVIWLLLMVRGRSGQWPVSSAETTAPASKPDQPKRKKKRGLLVVCGERFEFDYNSADEPEVVRLVELIKHSLVLLDESQYADIVASRAKETQTLMKQLRHNTRFEPGDLERMIKIFTDYAKELQGSKG